jgi:tetratricopeptide (TPR) repeat protein
MKSRKQQHNWLMLLVGNGYITLSISILLFGCVSAVTDSNRVLAKDDSSKIAQSPAATKENAERLFEEGKTLYQQGSAESLRQAIQKWQEARLLYRAVGDSEALRRNRGGEATTLNNIGLVYNALGEKQKALDYYNQALPLRRAVGDRGGQAATLNNIGRVYSDLGEKQKALVFYNQALPLIRAVGDPYGEAIILDNIRALGGF